MRPPPGSVALHIVTGLFAHNIRENADPVRSSLLFWRRLTNPVMQTTLSSWNYSLFDRTTVMSNNGLRRMSTGLKIANLL